MNRQIANTTIDVNDEGFVTNFSQWNKEVGEELARESSISLTPRHWQIIDYIQDEFRKETPLSIRKIGKSGVVDIKEFYVLFPKAPLKTATKIAGVPKPAGCI
jgi:dissimilatory sulfite reductase related protein